MTSSRPTSPPRPIRWVAVVALVCLAAAACGSRKNDSTSAPATTGANTTAVSSPGSFGTLANVCGPGTASGATALGVTDTEIRVGTLSDPGYTGAPGLNQAFFDTAKAFSDWCNAAGGIQGRKIKVDYLDAKVLEYKDRIAEACVQDFSLVGGGGVFDDTGAQDRVNCGLPDIAGYTVSAQATQADLKIEPIPNPITTQQVGTYVYLQQQNPDLKNGVGTMTGNFTSTKLVETKYIDAYKKLGASIVYQADYSVLGETNWTPFVTAQKAAGVKLLQYVGEPNNLVGLQKAMNDQNWYPDATLTDGNNYDQVFTKTGGPTAKNTYLYLYFHPFEEASTYPAVQQYLDILSASSPKSPPALLGMQGWSSWLMFAKSAAACGSNLTRDCLMTEAGKLTDWTGGGLHTKTDPGSNERPICIAVMQATDTGFKQVDPGADDGFTCNPANVVTTSVDVPPGARKGG